MAGEKYPKICELFTAKFGKAPPSRSGAWRMVAKLKNKYTVLDMRKVWPQGDSQNPQGYCCSEEDP